MVITGSRELKARYEELRPGDVFIGILSFKHLDKAVLFDLQARGIRCIPSPLAQVLNASKCAQAFVLRKWMLPLTRVVARRVDLIEAVGVYNRRGVGPVVTKQDRLHCGHGIRRWDHVEAVYSCLGLSEASYPMVLQPYVEDFTDVRVIIVGDYLEAYGRHNPFNFRANLSTGGQRRDCRLTDAQQSFCREAMARGQFPYAHLDLMGLDDGSCYLSEIALSGGTRGAAIGRRELDERKKAVLESLAAAGADADIDA